MLDPDDVHQWIRRHQFVLCRKESACLMEELWCPSQGSWIPALALSFSSSLTLDLAYPDYQDEKSVMELSKFVLRNTFITITWEGFKTCNSSGPTYSHKPFFKVRAEKSYLSLAFELVSIPRPVWEIMK